MAIGKRQLTYFEGEWHEGNTPIIGAADHAAWQGTVVFDGARFFEGVTPDLDHHAARVVKSAATMGMDAPVDGDTIAGLIRDGIKKMATQEALYLRPMMWSREASPALLDADPSSTAFAICLETLPMPEPSEMPLTVSPFRRPRQDTALTEAKAACLYPNNARIMTEARKRGFKNALSMDLDDNVAETASTNVFMVRDGVVMTPAHNGTFLNGITRRRTIALLRADGFKVEEATLAVADFRDADEIFLTGNASKITPVTQLDARSFDANPVAQRARELYWDFAHSKYESMPL